MSKNYYELYLKYKLKYLALLEEQKLEGGGYFDEYNKTAAKKIAFKTYNIMANIKPESNIGRGLQERKDLVLKRRSNGKKLHVTLLTFEFNRSFSNKDILNKFEFKDDTGNKSLLLNIKRIINDAYMNTFRKKPVVLKQILFKYDLMGNWFCKKFVIESETVQNTITEFRKIFYKEIEKLLIGHTVTFDNTDITGKPNNDYMFMKVNGEILFAIPKYYFGVGVWVPHVSLASMTDLNNFNKDLYYIINAAPVASQINPNENKENAFRDYIVANSAFDSLTTLNMSSDIMDEIDIL